MNDAIVSQQYVAGLCFSSHKEKVVLVRKQKPNWQNGLLNGVGGKVKVGEQPYQAMVREFKEETGLDVGDWELFLVLKGSEFVLYYYTTTCDHYYLATRQPDEQEDIVIADVVNILLLKHQTVSNLRWVMCMANDLSRHDWPYTVEENSLV